MGRGQIWRGVTWWHKLEGVQNAANSNGNELAHAVPVSDRPALSQVLLGLFVLGQLLFLAEANLLRFFVQALQLNAAVPFQEIDRGFTSYEKWTGQTQYWRLFSPFPPGSAFTVVQLRWKGGTTRTLPVLGDPAPSFRYWNPPGSGDRRFNYEQNLVIIRVFWEPKHLPHYAQLIRAQQREALRHKRGQVRAYLSWRLHQFRKEEPDLPPPDEVILIVRFYQASEPGAEVWQWRGPDDKPLARWQPGKGDELEIYDPIDEKLEPLP
jgi:hypothetical protein